MRALLHSLSFLSTASLSLGSPIADAAVIAGQEHRDAVPATPAVPTFLDARTILWQPEVKNAYPRWSNDGNRVLFQSNRSGKWHVFVMDADGARQRQLTTGDSNNNFPDWSPDNRRIAFVSDRDGNEEVYVMEMDGSGLKNVSQHPSRDIHPYWTPDGAKIVFNSTRDVDRLQIYEVAADGTGVRRLVESPDDDTCARVSPAGDCFVYLANLAIGQDDVMLRKRDGTDPVNLTQDRVRDGWPTWVPDGRRIVYSSQRTGTYCLFVMDIATTSPRQVTFAEAPYEDGRAAVSADRKRIVFNRARGETIGICVVDLPAENR